MLHNVFETRGLATIRACADDLGGVISGIEVLLYLERSFRLIKSIAALRLKPIKCVLVPLGEWWGQYNRPIRFL